MLTTDNIFLAFLGLALGFSFLIFVHELGHFAVAKFVGIKCTQFAIGFGQSLLTYRKGIGFRVGTTEPEYEKRIRAWLAEHGDEPQDDDAPKHDNAAIDRATQALGLGETEYRFNWMPLGGYVKMLGQEDMDPTARSNDPRSFNSKSIAARFWVLSAGVIMNLIFGAIFLGIAFSPWLGVEFPSAVVGGVRPDSPAERTFADGHEGDPAYQGLRTGDAFTHVHGKPVTDFMPVKLSTALGARGEPVPFTIKRTHPDGTTETLVYRIVPEMNPYDKMLSAGVIPSPSLIVDTVKVKGEKQAQVSRFSPAFGKGIEPGMRVVEVAGQPVETYAQFQRLVVDAKGEPVEVVYATEDGSTKITTQEKAIPTLTTQADDAFQNLLGLVPAAMIAPTDTSVLAGKAQTGDIIATLGTGRYPVPSAVFETLGENGDKPIAVRVLRDGEEVDFGEVTPDGGKLGVYLSSAETPVISRVIPDSPAARMEADGQALATGSRLLSVAGEPVATWSQAQRKITERVEAGDTEVTLAFELAIKDRPTVEMVMPLDEQAKERLLAAEWAHPMEMQRGVTLSTLNVLVRSDNVVGAVGYGVQKTHQFMYQTYLTLVRLAQGTVKPEHLRGPVGIIGEGTRVAQRGLPYLLFFLGLISVNLAVINYLPIPIVDGGHIMFLIIEKIKGSPLSVKAQTWASIAGLAVIGLVFLTTLYYDATREYSNLFGN